MQTTHREEIGERHTHRAAYPGFPSVNLDYSIQNYSEGNIRWVGEPPHTAAGFRNESARSLLSRVSQNPQLKLLLVIISIIWFCLFCASYRLPTVRMTLQT